MRLRVKTCKDCFFLCQDWHLAWKKDEEGNTQEYLELDNYCLVCDIFKRLDGFCDMWEPNA